MQDTYVHSLRKLNRAFNRGGCTKDDIWVTWQQAAKYYLHVVRSIELKHEFKRQIRSFVNITRRLLSSWGELVLADVKRVYRVLSSLGYTQDAAKPASHKERTVRRPMVPQRVAYSH